MDVAAILVAYMPDFWKLIAMGEFPSCLELDLTLVAFCECYCCIYRTEKVQRIVVFALCFRL